MIGTSKLKIGYEPKQKVWAWNGSKWQPGRIVRREPVCSGPCYRVAVYLPMPIMGSMVTSYKYDELRPRYDGEMPPVAEGGHDDSLTDILTGCAISGS